MLFTNALSLQKIDTLKYEGRIIGTYSSGNGIASSTIYISLMNDNSYYIYKQFEILEEGIYEQEYENIYSLSEQKNLIFFINRIYYVDDKGLIIILNKISETPTFINVKIEKSILA